LKVPDDEEGNAPEGGADRRRAPPIEAPDIRQRVGGSLAGGEIVVGIDHRVAAAGLLTATDLEAER
jgi:hypothetical protein